MKKGDKIRGLQMEDYNGADHQATQMNGRIYSVDYIDDAGQIHLQESGLAVIPNVDRFVLVDCATNFDKEMSDIYDVIDDYLKINDYIEDEDGIVLSKRGLMARPCLALPRNMSGSFKVVDKSVSNFDMVSYHRGQSFMAYILRDGVRGINNLSNPP